MKQFTPKQIVQLALDLDAFEPGPVNALSLRFDHGYNLNFQWDTAKKHGGRLTAQSAAGNLFSFPSLGAAKAWFKEVSGHEPEILTNFFRDDYAHNSVSLVCRPGTPPYLSAQIYPQ